MLCDDFFLKGLTLNPLFVCLFLVETSCLYSQSISSIFLWKCWWSVTTNSCLFLRRSARPKTSWNWSVCVFFMWDLYTCMCVCAWVFMCDVKSLHCHYSRRIYKWVKVCHFYTFIRWDVIQQNETLTLTYKQCVIYAIYTIIHNIQNVQLY